MESRRRLAIISVGFIGASRLEGKGYIKYRKPNDLEKKSIVNEDLNISPQKKKLESPIFNFLS